VTEHAASIHIKAAATTAAATGGVRATGRRMCVSMPAI
jgi:hypothetical protein